MQKKICEESHFIEVDVLYKKKYYRTCPHYRSKKIFLVKMVIDHYNEEHIKKVKINLCNISEKFYVIYVLILEFKRN